MCDISDAVMNDTEQKIDVLLSQLHQILLFVLHFSLSKFTLQARQRDGGSETQTEVPLAD